MRRASTCEGQWIKLVGNVDALTSGSPVVRVKLAGKFDALTSGALVVRVELVVPWKVSAPPFTSPVSARSGISTRRCLAGFFFASPAFEVFLGMTASIPDGAR